MWILPQSICSRFAPDTAALTSDSVPDAPPQNKHDVSSWVTTNRGQTGRTRKLMQCSDGFAMSVQASEDHYCLPQIDKGPWTHFEVGYPNRPEPMLEAWRDEPESEVFRNVPAEIITSIVTNHGGLR